mgnify:CR=1 FL=1|jgi:hypothetical protein
MIFPLNVNRVEQLDIDPVKKMNGYLWYNTVEKVYKSYVDDELQIFITDKSFAGDITGVLESAITNHEFSVGFTDTYKIIIKHNKGNTRFVYNLFDTEEQCNLHCSMEILNDNEVVIDFVDPVTGEIFMYFE